MNLVDVVNNAGSSRVMLPPGILYVAANTVINDVHLYGDFEVPMEKSRISFHGRFVRKQTGNQRISVQACHKIGWLAAVCVGRFNLDGRKVWLYQNSQVRRQNVANWSTEDNFGGTGMVTDI